MRFSFERDTTFRQVFSKTIDLKTAKFSLAAQVRRRIILSSLAFVPLIALCVYVGHPWVGVMAAWIGLFLVVWQVAGFGFGMVTPEKLAITHFYSKKQLIFVGCFWLLLFCVVAFLMYRKATG